MIQGMNQRMTGNGKQGKEQEMKMIVIDSGVHCVAEGD